MMQTLIEEWLVPEHVLLLDFSFCNHYVIQPMYVPGMVEFSVTSNGNNQCQGSIYLVILEMTRGHIKYTITNQSTGNEESPALLGTVKIVENVVKGRPKLRLVRKKGSAEPYKLIAAKIPIKVHEKCKIMEEDKHD